MSKKQATVVAESLYNASRCFAFFGYAPVGSRTETCPLKHQAGKLPPPSMLLAVLSGASSSVLAPSR